MDTRGGTRHLRGAGGHVKLFQIRPGVGPNTALSQRIVLLTRSTAAAARRCFTVIVALGVVLPLIALAGFVGDVKPLFGAASLGSKRVGVVGFIGFGERWLNKATRP